MPARAWIVLAVLMLLFATFWIAFRSLFVRTPWQPYLVTALAAFVGEVLEGVVIDTDHWRHFFLLLGMIWGLGTATFYYLHRRPVHRLAIRFPHLGPA